MVSHPNRNKNNRLVPLPEQVIKARESVGLTQTEAAAVVYVSMRAWQNWEGGHRPMPGAVWELFRVKTGLIPLKRFVKAE